MRTSFNIAIGADGVDTQRTARSAVYLGATRLIDNVVIPA